MTPRLTWSEAEQVAALLAPRWPAIMGDAAPIPAPEPLTDLVQAVLRTAADVASQREEPGAGA